MATKDNVLIFDTTLRDGEQSAGIGLTLDEKMEIARQLERLGVDIIEAGFAASSPGDFDAVSAIAREVRTPTIASLARCVPGDIDAAWDAIEGAERPRIHTFISSSDSHLMDLLRKNPEEVLDQAVSSVERASETSVTTSSSRRWTPPAPTSSTCTGCSRPASMPAQPRSTSPIRSGMPCHPSSPSASASSRRTFRTSTRPSSASTATTTSGNAAPNSIAAVIEGARQVEGCINGLGERAGNASLEEVIMTIETRGDALGVTTNIDTRQIYRTSRLVSDITGFPVQPNKAIVGANAFRHASGIHQDGVIKSRTTFEIMDPQTVGWPSSSLVLGKLSGRAGLRSRLEELGLCTRPVAARRGIPGLQGTGRPQA